MRFSFILERTVLFCDDAAPRQTCEVLCMDRRSVRIPSIALVGDGTLPEPLQQGSTQGLALFNRDEGQEREVGIGDRILAGHGRRSSR
jgi:hypothetical protein